jgi:hypothetical protein
MGKYTFIALTVFVAIVLFTVVNTIQYGSQYRTKIAQKFKEKQALVSVAKAKYRKNCVHLEKAAEAGELTECAILRAEFDGFETSEQIIEWAKKEVYHDWDFINIQTIEVMGLIVVMFCIVAIGILFINFLRGCDIKLRSSFIPMSQQRKKSY